MRYVLFFGIVVGLILARLSNQKFGISFDTVLEVLIGGMFFGIIGARLYYVLFKLEYYLASPSQMFNLRDGGLAIYGGILSIIIFLIVYCKIRKIKFLDLVDYLIPYLALGQSIGRWGNFFNVEAYGSKTNSILRMGINSSSGYIEVHPVFLYESICTFLIFIILCYVKKNRKFEGQVFFLYFILYGIVRMILEGIRVDSLMLAGIRISQLLSVLLFSIFSLFYFQKNKKR